MNHHIRITALIAAVAMILTLFVFAVDAAPAETKADAPTTTAAVVKPIAAIAIVAAEDDAEAASAAADEPAGAVPIRTVTSIETVSSAADKAVTEAVKSAVERVRIEDAELPAEEAEVPAEETISEAAEVSEPEPVEEPEPAAKTETAKKTVTASACKGSYNWGVTSYALSDEDRELIERVVAAEAMGCVYEGLVGVAQVIRERAESWGMTAREVVLAESQFAAPYQGEYTDEVRQAVSDVFDDGVRVFEEHTTHFHNTSVDPFWNKHKEFRGEIDTHLFWGVDE